MASPLRKWLKKEDIYDSDLEKILTEQGVNDPATDFKTYTVSQWEELNRKAVVERAKELKDQKAKMRLEKKMIKLEKFWRKESGLKKTSKQKDKNKSSSSSYSKDKSSKSVNNDALESASALKKYLKKNQCFDKDLVIILATKYDVKNEDDLSKIDSNSKYDEIYRQIRVLRAKDLKDNAARLRMQKNMTKFEKLWRSKTNIKKKSSVNDKNGGKKGKNKKDPKSAKNDELSGAGKELKNWMKKNSVWETALYQELMNNKITTADELCDLSQSKFDEIVRKVRVDRFSQLKDQKSRNRADKLLITFERAWRKSSGIKKTSIKKKKGGAASPKNADNADKEELLPWYLSGKQKNTKKAALASAPRSAAKKKKDAKLNEKLRESSKIEKEWIEIYSMAKYNGYIAPAEEKQKANGNGNKKKKKKDDDPEPEQETDEIKKEEENAVPNLYSIEVDFEEIVVDVCMEMFLTLHESWEGRCSILDVLVKQLCDANITDDIYALKLCKFLCSIGHQFTDPRSLIIQAMEEQMSKLIKTTPTKIIYFAPYILKSLFVTFPVRIEALRDPGVKLGKFLVNELNSYDTEHRVLRTVFDGFNSKHGAVRTECAEYLSVMLKKIGLLEKDDASESDKLFLKEIDEAVIKATKDASSEARMNGYRALTVYKRIAPNAAQTIIDKMTKAQTAKFEEANAGNTDAVEDDNGDVADNADDNDGGDNEEDNTADIE